jgi:hypothetical protein
MVNTAAFKISSNNKQMKNETAHVKSQFFSLLDTNKKKPHSVNLHLYFLVRIKYGHKTKDEDEIR